MSSDEEGADGSLVSKPPSWESKKFRMLKDTVDKQYLALASVKSKRLYCRRKVGSHVQRDKPNVKAHLKWIMSHSEF